MSAILTGIDGCLRRWKASRQEGQAVLTELSNALLLRTYVDKGRDPPGVIFGGGGGGGGAVWGSLAHAGTTVSRVSVAAEARVRSLHGDLSALQDVMLAAAAGVRRHAEEARRRLCRPAGPVEHGASHGHAVSGGDGGGGGSVTAVARCADQKPGAGAGRRSAGRAGVEEDGTGAGDGDGGAIIGGGYGLADLADAASEVAEMLLREALVTATIVQGVGRESNKGDREALTVYAAAWMMQPYVDARRVKELETMVGGKGLAGRGRA